VELILATVAPIVSTLHLQSQLVDCQSGFFPDEISPKRNQKFKIEKDVVLEIFNHQDEGEKHFNHQICIFGFDSVTNNINR
jgi:hypothetical protein